MKFDRLSYFILEEGRPSFKDKLVAAHPAASELDFKDGTLEDSVMRFLDGTEYGYARHADLLQFIENRIADKRIAKDPYVKVRSSSGGVITPIAKQARAELKEMIGGSILHFIDPEVAETEVDDPDRAIKAIEDNPEGDSLGSDLGSDPNVDAAISDYKGSKIGNEYGIDFG